MNKYVFPGADASCSLGWVIGKVCYLFLPVTSSTHLLSSSWRVLVSKSKMLMFSVSITLLPSTAGIKIGSATRTALLPSTVTDGSESGHSSLHTALSRAGKSLRVIIRIISNHFHLHRQGGASVFQITMHKNLNAFHRIEGVNNHASIHVKLDKEPS